MWSNHLRLRLRLSFDKLEHFYQLVLLSTSSFTNELVQNVPAHQSSSLSANELVLACLLTNWYKMFQLLKIWHELEHFVPACQKFQFTSKWTGSWQSELVKNVPVCQNSISIWANGDTSVVLSLCGSSSTFCTMYHNTDNFMLGNWNQ